MSRRRCTVSRPGALRLFLPGAGVLLLGLAVPPVSAQEEASKAAGTGAPAPAQGVEDVVKVFEDAKSALDSTVDAQVFGGTSDSEAVAIVDRYLEAVGGKEVLGAVTDHTAKFRNLKYSPTGQTEAEIAQYLKRGYKFREEWEIKGFKIQEMPLAFVQIYNGDAQEGWVKMLGTVSPLEGRTLSVFVWDKYLDDFFAHWQEDGFSLKKAGRGLVDGEECEIVEVRDFTERQRMRYFFSTKTGLLAKKEWFDSTGKDTVKKEQYYKLYRRIAFSDGSGRALQFPLKLETYVDGEIDTERVFTQVLYNSALSDELFAKPEGKPFTGAITGAEAPARPDDASSPVSGASGEGPAHGGHPVIRRPGGSREGSSPRERPTRRAAPVEEPEEAPAGAAQPAGGSGEPAGEPKS